MKYKRITTSLVETIIKEKSSSVSKRTNITRQALVNHLKNFQGNDPKRKVLTNEVCEAFVNYLSQNMKDSSCRTYIQTLSTILNEAEQQGLIDRNPLIRTNLPKRNNDNKTFLTREELHQLVKCRDYNSETHQGFLLSCHTGLSLSDIRALSWDDIIKDDDTHLISKELERGGHRVQIPLTKPAIEIIANLQHKYNELPTSQQDNRVVHMHSNTSLIRDLSRWAEQANINKNITFSTARNTFGTLAILAGVDLYTLSQWMGHSSVASTCTYLNLVTPSRTSYIHALEKIFL